MSGQSHTAELLGVAAEVDLDTVMMLDGLVGGPMTRYLAWTVGCSATHVRTVTRSAWRDNRETDVHIDTDAGAVLIENKIGASFQPGQPASYAAEVARLRAEGTPAWAIVVFPKSRTHEIVTAAEDAFDAFVTIEQLIDEPEWDSGELARASLAVLRRALQPKAVPSADPERSAWGDEYRATAAALWTAEPLGIGPKALRTRDSVYVQFTGPSIGKAGWVLHYPQRGEVEVTLKGSELDPATIPARARQCSEQSWRIDVPPMSFDTPVAEQRTALAAAISEVQRAHAWLLAHWT